MKTFSKLLLAIIVWSLFIHTNARANSDSVKYRLVSSYLPDSSMIRYELGSIGHITPTGITYLRFADTFISTFSQCWRSTSFTKSSSIDSVSFLRFASFDNQHQLGQYVGDTLDLYNFGQDFLSRYIDTEFYITPNTTDFNATSRILYVVEIHQASNDSLLKRIDTLACFLDDTGRFVFAVVGDSQFRTCSLNGIPFGTGVYLAVNRITTLPSGSSIIADLLTIEATNAPAVQSVSWCAFQLPWSNAPAFKQPDGTISSAQSQGIVVINGNSITIPTLLQGDLDIQISDILGRTAWLGKITNSSTANTLQIPYTSLPAGYYFVSILQDNYIVARGKMLAQNDFGNSNNVGGASNKPNQQSAFIPPNWHGGYTSHSPSPSHSSRSTMRELMISPYYMVKGYIGTDGTYWGNLSDPGGSNELNNGQDDNCGQGDNDIVGIMVEEYDACNTCPCSNNPVPGYFDTGKQTCFIGDDNMGMN